MTDQKRDHHNFLDQKEEYCIQFPNQFHNQMSSHHPHFHPNVRNRLSHLNYLFKIKLILLIALLSSTTTSLNAQHSTCPNAKQIEDLKPLNVNLNCDCSQTADGQSSQGKAGWEIMCYSVENLHNNGNIN